MSYKKQNWPRKGVMSLHENANPYHLCVAVLAVWMGMDTNHKYFLYERRKANSIYINQKMHWEEKAPNNYGTGNVWNRLPKSEILIPYGNSQKLTHKYLEHNSYLSANSCHRYLWTGDKAELPRKNHTSIPGLLEAAFLPKECCLTKLWKIRCHLKLPYLWWLSFLWEALLGSLGSLKAIAVRKGKEKFTHHTLCHCSCGWNCTFGRLPAHMERALLLVCTCQVTPCLSIAMAHSHQD